MADFRMDTAAIREYAITVDETAAKLSPEAVGQLPDGAVSARSFGELGQELKVIEAYERAKSALRQHLEVGAAALRSASASLREVTSQHGANEEEAISQVAKIHKPEA